MRHSAYHKEFNGWFVAGLFVLFLCSMVVYRVASTSFPEIEAAAESPSTPLPAAPHRLGTTVR